MFGEYRGVFHTGNVNRERILVDEFGQAPLRITFLYLLMLRNLIVCVIATFLSNTVLSVQVKTTCVIRLK